ncbi:MAG: SHOCT domain-containing protein [Erysipelotrichaceae bacterium]|jgi:uncharacterized membrane protein|nr:SHOCT domain-containing protein [Erysipelotrichaceae bacterium]
MPLLLIAIGVIAYFVFVKDSKGYTSSNAEEILKRRFVNGEIDETQYNRMKETLRR